MADSVGDLDAGPMTEEEVQKCVKVLGQIVPGITDQTVGKELLALNVSLNHEKAKKALIAAGRPKEKVEAMPHFQVALLHAVHDLDRIFYDEIRLAENLPPWQALAKEREIAGRARVKSATIIGADTPAIPLARLLLPAFERIKRAQIRLDRRLAALRIVEGIRLYAAAHNGKLPNSLAEIKDVAVPVDPLTGKAFEYEIVENTAVIKGAVPPEEKARMNEWITYEVTIRK
jgi:hypothetical protein